MAVLVGNFGENYKIKNYLVQSLLANKYLQVVMSEELYHQEFREFFKKTLGINENCISIEAGSVLVSYNPTEIEEAETYDLREDPEPTKAYIRDCLANDKPFLVKMKLQYYDKHFVGILDNLLRQYSSPDFDFIIQDDFAVIKYKNEAMVGTCEYCNSENVKVKEYDLGDGESAIGCIDEDRCKRQMMYNEYGASAPK
ncbi:hypothetical protein ACFSR7_05895 [Cohnella sp. GCM10020058]|uniref:hypothetical protein n=1 Tax=Cohnella sp. GCM10020058 TaxID=3317330 RepID=UPI00362B7C9B